jgi:hypothetical protein
MFLGVGEYDHDHQSHYDKSAYKLLDHGCHSSGCAISSWHLRQWEGQNERRSGTGNPQALPRHQSVCRHLGTDAGRVPAGDPSSSKASSILIARNTIEASAN